MAARPRIELDSDLPHHLDGRHTLALALQSVRMEFYRRTMVASRQAVGEGRALVVGSGRGLLARALCRAGYEVHAVEASPRASRLAMATNRALHLDIQQVVADPADLDGLGHGAFDLVWITDTLERRAEIDPVVRSVAARLAPDGVLIYDTISRTLVSQVIVVHLLQRGRRTRVFPHQYYQRSGLRRPSQLAATLRQHGLAPDEVCAADPLGVAQLLGALVRRCRGDGDDADVAAAGFALRPGRRPSVLYLGSARPTPPLRHA